MVELLDGNGNIVGRSDNSPSEVENPHNFLEPVDRLTGLSAQCSWRTPGCWSARPG